MHELIVALSALSFGFSSMALLWSVGNAHRLERFIAIVQEEIDRCKKLDEADQIDQCPKPLTDPPFYRETTI